MKKSMTICLAVLMLLTVSAAASAASWEILDAGLQDTTNFVNTGSGVDGNLNGRSDIAGDPGTRYNITLTGTGWVDIQIGDGYDLPLDNDGLTAATGNASAGNTWFGDLSSYSGYSMTIKNPNASGWFMAALYLNTGWTDPTPSQPDRYYQDSEPWATWIGPGQSATITLDFSNAVLCSVDGTWSPVSGQTVLNDNYVSNIGLKIGSNMGSGDYQMPSGLAFDVDTIPEPATLGMLMLSGGVGMLLRRRRV